MIDDHMLDGVLDKIKMILCIAKLDDTKIQIDTDIRLADKVTLKKAVILMSCDNDKFYIQLFSEEALVA